MFKERFSKRLWSEYSFQNTNLKYSKMLSYYIENRLCSLHAIKDVFTYIKTLKRLVTIITIKRKNKSKLSTHDKF